MLVPQAPEHQTTDEHAAKMQLEQVMLANFCRTLNGTRLSPVTVLRMMAGALGKAYANVAAAHSHGDCPCGWRPSPTQDLEAIRAALSVDDVPGNDLMRMTAAGHA
jgi:hypothetical protein